MREKRRLGKTDIEITPIGLGCWQFSQGVGIAGGFWSNVATEGIFDVVDAALKGGISWFDTAEAYGRGRSEQNLSAALSKLGVKPGSVAVATKWMPFMPHGALHRRHHRHGAFPASGRIPSTSTRSTSRQASPRFPRRWRRWQSCCGRERSAPSG